MISPSCTTIMSCKLMKAHLLRAVKGGSHCALTASYKESTAPSCFAMKQERTVPSTNHMQRSGCDYLLNELKPTGALGFQGLLWSNWLFWKVFTKTVTGFSVNESMESSPASLASGTIVAKSPWYSSRILWKSIPRRILTLAPYTYPLSPCNYDAFCLWDTWQYWASKTFRLPHVLFSKNNIA